MVNMERRVDMLIILDENTASPPYFSAKMAVLAAAGMADRITET